MTTRHKVHIKKNGKHKGVLVITGNLSYEEIDRMNKGLTKVTKCDGPLIIINVPSHCKVKMFSL